MYWVVGLHVLFTMLSLGCCSLLGPEILPKPFLSTKCKLKTHDEVLPYEILQGQINRVSAAKPNSDNDEVMVCKIKDVRAIYVGFAEITTVPTEWQNQSMITFVTNENLAAKLRDVIIECPVADRNLADPSEPDSVQEYVCDHIVGLQINFLKGKHHNTMEKDGKETHGKNRRKRSALKRTKRRGQSLEFVDPCLMNEEEGLYLYNASGKPDCILCETDYFVNTKSNSCTPCPPNTSRPGPHGFTKCIYNESEMNTNTKEKEESTVTSFASESQPRQPTVSPPPRSTVPKSHTEKAHSHLLLTNCIPTDLRIENKTSTTAFARWCPLLCAMSHNISSLTVIAFERSHEKETRKSYNVGLSATYHEWHDLQPNTTYCMAIQALTSNGTIPVSKTLLFHTNPRIRMPSDVNVTPSGSEVNVEWQRHEDEKLLNVMVEYKNLDYPTPEFGSLPFGKGASQKITFFLPKAGHYKLSIHYFDDQQHHGPYSKWYDVKTKRDHICSGEYCYHLKTLAISTATALFIGFVIGYNCSKNRLCKGSSTHR